MEQSLVPRGTTSFDSALTTQERPTMSFDSALTTQERPTVAYPSAPTPDASPRQVRKFFKQCFLAHRTGLREAEAEEEASQLAVKLRINGNGLYRLSKETLGDHYRDVASTFLPSFHTTRSDRPLEKAPDVSPVLVVDGQFCSGIYIYIPVRK